MSNYNIDYSYDDVTSTIYFCLRLNVQKLRGHLNNHNSRAAGLSCPHIRLNIMAFHVELKNRQHYHQKCTSI